MNHRTWRGDLGFRSSVDMAPFIAILEDEHSPWLPKARIAGCAAEHKRCASERPSPTYGEWLPTLIRLGAGVIEMNLKAVSLLFEENPLFGPNNSLFLFQNALFR